MSQRTNRIRSEIQREIALMLERGEVKDPRLSGLISISDVEVSRDLQYATVYMTVFGGEGEDPGAQDLKILNGAAGFIRSRLSRRLSMRQTPQLRFAIDGSFEYGSRMDRLLKSLNLPQTPSPEEEER
ncbi:MAG: 30S ribosome-binding factor RbfA [Magnetococcales bacterium]|nr:30S ribosome-binding factor RbfA [Magnetococcales bacterium]